MFSACRAPEDLVYIADTYRNSPSPVVGKMSNGIQVNDLLGIYVESSTPDAALPFNQETNRIAHTISGAAVNPSSGANLAPGYRVSQTGDINFPVLGTIRVAGMTHAQVAALLEKRLVDEGHIKDPKVTVKLLNFKVSVLGEVSRPSQLVVDGDRITIFEALSQCGDITIHGQRTNVTVIREENGLRTVGNLDLTSDAIFDSPFYYLHQNDVVYVEPNKSKKRSSNSDAALTMSWISFGASLLQTAAMMFYYYILSTRY